MNKLTVITLASATLIIEFALRTCAKRHFGPFLHALCCAQFLHSFCTGLGQGFRLPAKVRLPKRSKAWTTSSFCPSCSLCFESLSWHSKLPRRLRVWKSVLTAAGRIPASLRTRAPSINRRSPLSSYPRMLSMEGNCSRCCTRSQPAKPEEVVELKQGHEHVQANSRWIITEY